MSVSRSLISRSDRIHEFAKVASTVGDITSSSTSFSFEPKLSDLQGYSDIQNLFDYYRIMAYEILFIPNRNTSDITAASAAIPNMWIVNDQDGGGPSAETGFMEKPTARIQQMIEPFKWVNKSPRFSLAVYQGVTTGYAVGGRSQWLDCTSDGVPHFGTYCLMKDNANMAGNIRYFVKVYFQAKGLK